MKNRIAIKLTLYFTGVLLVFALIIGGLFYQFFKEHTIDVKKREMSFRAQKISEVLSANLELMTQKDISGNNSFINLLDNMTQEIVWVVDSDRTLYMNQERLPRRPMGPPPEHERGHHMQPDGNMMGHRPPPVAYPDGSGRPMPPPPPKQEGLRLPSLLGIGLPGGPPPEQGPRRPTPPANGQEAYERMPQHIKENLENGFRGQRFVIEEYNPVFDTIMLTVGTPVYDAKGQVRSVVLLHSPVAGLHDAVWAGLRILLYSLLAALVLGVVLSVVLSWRFTKPMNIMKNIAERLAERDYAARTNISQNDEVGDLARTLDVLAHRLQLADEESQKLEKLRREFIANISHELRTPVTVIRGSLEAMRDGVVTEPAEIKEFHEQMYKESVYLQRMINDLLDLSRLQNMDFPIEKAPLNLCDAIQDAVRGSRRLGLEKELQITAQLDTDIYMLDGDYGRLRQMLMIFLHNSVKFSPVGSSILVQLEGSVAKVVDHGCGIKAEDVPHAFDRFYKARNEHNKEGSGLGLAIAKQIALRHNIVLEVESVEHEGTTIIMQLPPQLKMEEQADE